MQFKLKTETCNLKTEDLRSAFFVVVKIIWLKISLKNWIYRVVGRTYKDKPTSMSQGDGALPSSTLPSSSKGKCSDMDRANHFAAETLITGPYAHLNSAITSQDRVDFSGLNYQQLKTLVHMLNNKTRPPPAIQLVRTFLNLGSFTHELQIT